MELAVVLVVVVLITNPYYAARSGCYCKYCNAAASSDSFASYDNVGVTPFKSVWVFVSSLSVNMGFYVWVANKDVTYAGVDLYAFIPIY